MIQKTKPFKAVSMPCTEEQFKNELKPILEFLEVDTLNFWGWKSSTVYITTNYGGIQGDVGNVVYRTSKNHNRQYHPEFCPKTFIEALGYDFIYVMEVIDREQNLKLHWDIPTHYKIIRPTHYKIIRPILFFAKSDVVHRKTLRKYFTKKAIKQLIKQKYIINQ